MTQLEIVSLSLFVIVVYMTCGWLISVIRHDASTVDPFWGLGFVLLAVVYAITGDGFVGRKALVCTLVAIWGFRLAGYILVRNWGKGEDYRYQAFRQRWGKRYWWVSFFQVFMLQGLLLWVIAMSLMAAESKGSTQNVGDAMRQAKEWRRKVTALGRKCSRLDIDVPEILTALNGGKTVVDVTAKVEAMLKMLSDRKNGLVGEEIDDYVDEGEAILAELKTADADQEIKHLKSLSDAMVEFSCQKGMLAQALKALNEAGRELHYKSPVDAAKYNLSILYRNTGKRKQKPEETSGSK